MVNYKRVICKVAVLAVLAVVSGAPTDSTTEGYYDRRQNAVDDNIRATIDGIFIAVAPADSLLDTILDFDDSTNASDLEAIAALLKPSLSGSSTAKPVENESKPDSEKPAESPLSDVPLQSETKAVKKEASRGKLERIQRLKNRLANVLIPLLRKHVNAEA